MSVKFSPHIAIIVKSEELDYVIKFYEDVFGWEKNVSEGQTCFINEGVTFWIGELLDESFEPTSYNYKKHNIWLEVESNDLDKICEKLKQYNIKFFDSTPMGEGYKDLYFFAPGGQVFHIYEKLIK